MNDVCTLVALNAGYIHTSLSVRALALYCNEFYASRGEQRRVGFLELTVNQPFDALRAEVLRNLSPVVGFSCYLWNVEIACKLAQAVKLVRPDVRIVFGGAELEGDVGFAGRHPYVDDVIYGEGEQALLNLLEGTNESAEVLPRLAYDLAELPKAPQIIYYEGSRGCPFSCAFCLSGRDEPRFSPTDRVIRELTALANAQVLQVKLVDRTFNAHPKRALEIWSALAALDTRTNFHFEIASALLDDDALALLERVPKGRFQFEIGVQSTNPQTLAAINRKNDIDQTARVVSRLKKSDNIHIHLDLIAGLPNEDIASFERSFDEVFAMRPHMLQLGFLKLLRGSALREDERFNVLYADYPPYEVLQTDCMSYTDLLRLKRTERALERYYNKQGWQSLNYMLRFIKPFEFFSMLGEFVDAVDVTKDKAALEQLCLFAQSTQTQGVDPGALKALAQYDFLIAQKRSGLIFDEQDDTNAREFYRTRAMDYVNCPPSQCHKHCRVLAFEYGIPELIQEGRAVVRRCYILFDYVDFKATEVLL